MLYLSLFASVLTFSLYYPVVRRIGPGKAAYSSVDRADHRDGLFDLARTLSLDRLAVAGAVLALGGMAAALRRKTDRGFAAPDAA